LRLRPTVGVVAVDATILGVVTVGATILGAAAGIVGPFFVACIVGTVVIIIHSSDAACIVGTVIMNIFFVVKSVLVLVLVFECVFGNRIDLTNTVSFSREVAQ
jgi:hypothetical protein